jgi:hypothetical protein
VVARFVHTEEVTGSNPVSPTNIAPCQQLAAAVLADRDGRKIGLQVRRSRVPGRMENLSVRRGVAVASVVPVSLLVSMVRRVATRTVDCCLEQCATRRC